MNDNKVSSHDTMIFHCGELFYVSTSLYFHVFRVKFASAEDSSCDYIQLYEYLVTGTTVSEIFKSYTKKVACTCRIKRGFLSSLSYLIPLIYTFAV